MTEQQAVMNYMARNELMSFAPSAALIDMDGTLYDSMGHHADAWYRMISELGIECDRDEFFMYEGRTGVDTINIILRRVYGHDASPEQAKELYRRKTVLFSEMPPVEPMKGAQRMVKALLDNRVSTVLVTGSGQNTLLNRLDTDYPGAFPAGMRVTGHDVSQGKPHPEPFLKGMRLAGVHPENSIAIDNAPLGVMAGAASGAFTIGVTTGPIPEKALWDAGADIVYPSMDALADNIGSLVNSFNMSI